MVKLITTMSDKGLRGANVSKATTILTLILSFSLLLCYAASFIDPRYFWPLAFAGLMYPVFLLLNTLMLGYLLFFGKRLCLLPLGTILLGYHLFIATIGIHFCNKELPPRSEDIKLLTYNVHSFMGADSFVFGAQTEKIVSFITANQPDIICMQEFISMKIRDMTTVDSIKQVCKSNGYYFIVLLRSWRYDAKLGMVIFSRYPIIDENIIKISEGQNQCIYIDVKKGNNVFRIYNVHLESIGLDPASVTTLNNSTASKQQKLQITKNIGSRIKNAFLQRSKQMWIIKNHALHCPYPYIIAGDFNDTPSSFVVSQMGMGLHNAFAEKGMGFCRTYRGKYPNFQIDYVLASQAFEVTSYKVPNVSYSDHFPVVVRLRLPLDNSFTNKQKSGKDFSRMKELPNEYENR